MSEHYDEATLGDYVEDPERFAGRETLERHVASCPSCAEMLEDLRTLEEALEATDLWEAAEALRRQREAPEEISALADTLDRESADAAQRLASLVASPIIFKRANVAAQPEMRTAGVVLELSRLARDLREKQPMHALTLADTAVALTDLLPQNRYPAIMVNELRGGAWLERANALRYLGRFQEALDALDIAERAFNGSSVATFSVALVQYLRAVIYCKTDQFEPAVRLARQSARVFRHFGEDDRYIHAKMIEAVVLFQQTRIADALALFESLLPVAKRLGDANTLARLYGNIANCHVSLHQHSEASSYFAQALSLYQALGLETEKVRVRWSLGRMLISSGRLADGIARLREARHEFEALGLTSDAALVTLDMVEAMLASGIDAEVATLCSALVESFVSVGMTGNALAALAYLREAAVAGQADVRLVQKARESIEQL